MAEASGIHAYKVISCLCEMLGKESISSAVVCVPIYVVDDAFPRWSLRRESVVRELDELPALFDLQVNRVDFRKLNLFEVDILLLEDLFLFCEFLSDELAVLYSLLTHCSASTHGLYDDLALLLVWVLALNLLQLLVVILSTLARWV